MGLPSVVRADYSLRALLLGLAGAGFGAVVFFAEPLARVLGVGDGWDDETREFVSQPETLFWLLLICAQTAFWALAAVPAWSLARSLSRWFSRSILVLGVLLSGLVVAFVVGVGQLRQDEVLEHQALKFGVVTAAGYIAAALPAALSIWAVQRAADGAHSLGGEPRVWLARFRGFTRDDLPHQAEPTGIDWFFLVRARLQRAVTILGLVIAAAVLATAGFRNANVAWEKQQAAAGKPPAAANEARDAVDPDSVFAFERVLIYGLGFTLLIALLYAPAHVRLQAVGERLRDALTPEPEAADDWPAAYERRGMLTTLLGLEAGMTASFGPAAAVAAPFITAVVGSLLAR